MDFIIKFPEFDRYKNIIITINYLEKEVIFKLYKYINTQTIINKFYWGIYWYHGLLRIIILN